MSELLVEDELREEVTSQEDDQKERYARFQPLVSKEELLLQQLLQSHYWSERNRGITSGQSAVELSQSEDHKAPFPENWELTRGLILHDWQNQCVKSWFEHGRRGVIKVVTGAGKTILALAIAEQLQRTVEPSLRVAIVVPTVVLLTQWQDELVAHSNLPTTAIGLMGGGHSGHFTDETRVMICVLNSASKKLPQEVEPLGICDRLLLIVDECHRAGASEMQNVFQTKRAYSLGLSATPERTEDPAADQDSDDVDGDDEPAPFEETVLGQQLGSVVFEMNYADAIQKGVLPPFRIVHYGLSLAPKEREEYDHLSREIKELRDELETGSRRGLALIRWCRSKAGSQNPRAVQLLSMTSERKRLLYRMGERSAAVLSILRRAFDQNPNTKAILFHESIDEVMALFDLLRRAGYAVVAEHSDFPDTMRAESLRLFRHGTARVIVSARSLIEGFNVPSADLGIVIAASSSVRQRIQTLGRLLRRNRTVEGTEKQAALYVLYAAKTVDELIYEKADWELFVGADRNDYLIWQRVSGSDPVPLSGPPRRPALDERFIDAQTLQPGGPYPGDSNVGRLYSLDTQGTIRDEKGILVQPHTQLRALLMSSLKAGGRFRITPVNRFVTRLEKTKEGWHCVYLGRLDTPLEAVESVTTDRVGRDSYTPGDRYPLARVHGKTFSVLQRDKRLIANKSRDGIRFVVPVERLSDTSKQAALRKVQEQLARVYERGHRINKITVTGEGHVVYVFENQAYFVGHAPEGAEGFLFEGKGNLNLRE